MLRAYLHGIEEALDAANPFVMAGAWISVFTLCLTIVLLGVAVMLGIGLAIHEAARAGPTYLVLAVLGMLAISFALGWALMVIGYRQE